MARYEAGATTLGAFPLDDPRPPASHLNHQASRDALREQLADATAETARDLLIGRLDAADLIADRRSIDAMPRVSVGWLPVEALNAAAEDAPCGHRDQADPGRDGRRGSARRASRRCAAGRRRREVRAGELSQVVARRGVDLGVTGPALIPTTAFYNRHARDRGLLDREITAGRFKDLPSYVPGALPC